MSNITILHQKLQAYNNTWDCRVHTTGRTSYIPQFPFFVEVSSHISNMVEQSIAEINKLDNVLQVNSDVVGMYVGILLTVLAI